MFFFAPKSIPSCQVTCESPAGSFDPVKDPEPTPDKALAERVQKHVSQVARHVSAGTNTEKEYASASTNTVSESVSASTNTISESVSASTNTVSDTVSVGTNTLTESVSTGTNTEPLEAEVPTKPQTHTVSEPVAVKETITEEVSPTSSVSTNTPPYNAQQAIICDKLNMLSNHILGFRETRERVDTIRDLHQALNQVKTHNILLRQRLKEARHECNLLMNTNAHMPPIDPLYQAVWMAGVFPQDRFVSFYRQNSQHIQLLYIQYLYKFGGNETEVCHSYGFQMYLREYLGCATNTRGPVVMSRSGSSRSSSAGSLGRSRSSSRTGIGSRIGSRSQSSRDSKLWSLEE
ncbi:hypothetical protein CJU90_4119 [Yarrowia sp. C11]|nr:hypothetical protein CKK34_5728 [Yarrowia sp. E02]KAG5367810.1 hypothetical protein CJU90_4119 [Yarrowia sp. C11]